MKRALVPVLSYKEEQAYISNEGSLDLGWGPMVTIQDGKYNMGLNTLLFIAGQGRGGMQQASKKSKNAPQGPCYNFNSYDHWARRDCLAPS